MMRVEPHGIGSIMHVVKRGARGGLIVRDASDRKIFMRSLFYLNDKYQNENWKRDTAACGTFDRPLHWPKRKPLVHILAWTLMPNHFHLLLEEYIEGGIAKFMQRLCNSMARTYNQKYAETGSLFQRSYKARTVHDDAYLRQLVRYILVKNVLELYPGGLTAALKDFDAAWEWGLRYNYSSFGATMRGGASPATFDEDGLIAEICGASKFKREARELVEAHAFPS